MSSVTAGSYLSVSIGGTVFAVDPSASYEEFDRKLTRLEMANGSRFATVDFYDSDSEAKALISLPVSIAQTGLLTNWGLGSTVGVPVATTIVYTTPAETTTCTSYLLNSIELLFQKGKVAMWNLEYMGTTAPAYSAGVSSPTIAADTSYIYFKDITALNTIASAGITGVSEFRLKLSHNLYAFYGIRTDGLALPTSLTPTEATLEGSVTILANGTTDLAAFVAACQTPADMLLTAKPFCPTTPPTLSLTPKACVYDKPRRSGGVKEAILRTFTWYSKNVGGANPLVTTFA